MVVVGEFVLLLRILVVVEMVLGIFVVFVLVEQVVCFVCCLLVVS